MVVFANDLKSIGYKKDDGGGSLELDRSDKVFEEKKNNLIDDLFWLSKNSLQHASVDTFARKLHFLKDDKSLQRLKATLSSYFAFEQSQFPVDKRYDSFHASVLDFDSLGKVTFPNNLRFLNWNYDTQIEKSFFGFCNDEDHVLEQMISKRIVFHINGFCGKTSQNHFGSGFRAIWEENPVIALESVVNLHDEYKMSKNPADIRFAWEQDTKTILENSLSLKDVTSLIIICYSFPYFNRKIDKMIFNQFNNKLNTIYLQYIEGDHKVIRQRLKYFLKEDINIIDVDSKEYFYIPDELDVE